MLSEAFLEYGIDQRLDTSVVSSPYFLVLLDGAGEEEGQRIPLKADQCAVTY